MPHSSSAEIPSYDRLIATVQEQWELGGAAGMSARQISGLTGAPVSSIYHHFGSLEHLFLRSQQACIAAARQWGEEQLRQFDGFAPSPHAFAGFFAQIVDAWCEQRRPLAFAWRECQLLAQQSPLFREPAEQWSQVWERFWDEAARRFGLGDGTLVVRRVFENESFLHMIRWRRMVDRAALDETARSLSAWLTGTAMPVAPWREYAREEALCSMPTLPDRDDTAARIVDAAARIIDEEGLARLTHRAVADRGGLTLGTVSHKFRTKSALLEAAFEGLYRANVERLQPETAPRGDLADDLAGMLRRGGNARGSDELFLATARDPGLSQFGAQLRYLRGRTSRSTLQDLVGEHRTVGVTEAALFSSFLTSQLRIYARAQTDTVRPIRAELTILTRLVQRVSAT